MSELETFIISEFQRNAEEKVRLGLKAYKGKVYFDLRVWFPDKETLQLIPSKRGICLNLDCLPQMREFMQTLESAKTCLPEGFVIEQTASVGSVQTKPSEPVEAKPKAALTPIKEKRYERSSQFK
jgi:hypothetical protein